MLILTLECLNIYQYYIVRGGKTMSFSDNKSYIFETPLGEIQRMFKSTNGTKKDAEKELQRLLNELDRGTYMVTIPKSKPYSAEIYDEDEIIILLNKAKGTDMEVPITIAITLGLRRGELLGLKWAETFQCNINANLWYPCQGCI